MKNVQIVPIEEVGIPIDIITKTAMNISLNAGEEITESQTISVIPDGITIDQIIKMAIKRKSYFANYDLKTLKELKISPKYDNFTYNDILNMAIAADLTTTLETPYAEPKLAIMVSNAYGEFCQPRAIDSMDRDEVVDNILKHGIYEGIKAFEELSIKPRNDTFSLQEIIATAEKAGLFEQRITVGTGNFTETSKNITLYDSRKRNITNHVTFSVQSPNVTSFTEFDYAVLDACLNEKKHGNVYTTVNRIFHILGGGQNLTPKMKDTILESIERLAGVRLHICIDQDSMKKGVIPKDQQGRFHKDRYGDDFIFNGYLLPTESATATINGKTVDAIHLLNGGALLNNAVARNQFATADLFLLHPPIRCTEKTIATNHYLLRRSKEIIGSNALSRKHVKKLQRIITFDDMYRHIGISNGTRKQKQDARKTALKILDFFVKSKLLKGYSIENKNGYPYSIHIVF